MKPSRVIAPGPFDDAAIRSLKMYDDEETLSGLLRVRASDGCSKGASPFRPLLTVEGREVYGWGLRDLYRFRRLRRPWVPTKRWDPDLGTIEDFLALIALTEGKITGTERNRRVMQLRPFLRRFETSQKLIAAGRRAMRKLEKVGVLKRVSSRTLVLAKPLAAQLTSELLPRWLDPHVLPPAGEGQLPAS